MNSPADELSALWRRAEAKIAPADLPAAAEVDPVRLLHELQVHKVELELQNEELISANREIDALRRRYETLYEHAPVGYLRLSPEASVLGANQRAFAMLKRRREMLVGSLLRECFAAASVAAFDALIASASHEGVALKFAMDDAISRIPH